MHPGPHLLALALPRRHEVLDQVRLPTAAAAGEEQVFAGHGQLLDALLLLAEWQHKSIAGGACGQRGGGAGSGSANSGSADRRR